MLNTEQSWTSALGVFFVSPWVFQFLGMRLSGCLVLQVWEWSPQMQIANRLNTCKKQWNIGVPGWPLSGSYSKAEVHFWLSTGVWCSSGHHQFTHTAPYNWPRIFPRPLSSWHFLRCVFRITHLMQIKSPRRRPVTMVRWYLQVKDTTSYPLPYI